MSVSPPRPAKKISRAGLYAMPIVIVVLAVGVSIWWMAAARFAEASIDKLIAHEAEEGRRWSCGERLLGGFPFRIEAECRMLHVVAEGPKSLDVRLPSLRAVAQIYDPRLMIFEADGPAEIAFASLPTNHAQWTMLRASAHLALDGEIDRLSIETGGLKVSVKSSAAESDTIPISLTHGEIHLRKHPDENTHHDTIDFAFALRDLVIQKVINTPSQFETQGMIKNGQTLLGFAGPLTLDQWRDQGGAVKIASLTFSNEKQNLSLTGKIALDAQRKPKGEIELSGSGLADLFKLSGNPKLAALQTKDVKIPLVFSNGKLLLGPFALADMHPLY